MPNSMTFEKEGDYLVCYINGKEVSRAKVKSAGADEQEIIDIINEQIVANPVLSGTEPELTGFQKGEDKYAVPTPIPVEANPQLEGGEPTLTSLLVGTTKYAVPQGGSSLLSDIVDANGNYRFVEGNGVPMSRTGFTSTYCKWSLSGTHLMCVIAGNLVIGTHFYANTVVAEFTVPSYIGNKIYPVWSDNINKVTINLWSTTGTLTQIEAYIKYSNNVISLKTKSVQQDVLFDSSFRFQIDLLIDAS